MFVKICIIGFDNKDFNEVDFVCEIVEKYKIEYYEYIVYQNVVDRLEYIVSFFDELFVDLLFVLIFFVLELVRKVVIVVFVGDGGDEMFVGYEKYLVDDIENKFRNKFFEVV